MISTTSRPLLVTVKSSEEISQILKAARKLCNSTEFKAIFVKKDSTLLEQAEIKKLLEDRNKRGRKQKRRWKRELDSQTGQGGQHDKKAASKI